MLKVVDRRSLCILEARGLINVFRRCADLIIGVNAACAGHVGMLMFWRSLAFPGAVSIHCCDLKLFTSAEEALLQCACYMAQRTSFYPTPVTWSVL